MIARVIAFVAGSVVLAGVAAADPRPFAFNTDAYSIGKGNWEYEQYVTWNHHTDADHGFNQFDFKHEIEFGVTDKFDMSVYLANWSYENSSGGWRTHYESSAIEGIYYFSNPATDPVGVALYTELGIGDRLASVENKLIVQKDVGNWSFIYNLVAETKFEGVFDSKSADETHGELTNTFGVSYALTPSLKVGAEAYIACEFEEWKHHEGTAIYAGPNFNWQITDKWWMTVAPLVQLSDRPEEPDFVVRAIVGYEF